MYCDSCIGCEYYYEEIDECMASDCDAEYAPCKETEDE